MGMRRYLSMAREYKILCVLFVIFQVGVTSAAYHNEKHKRNQCAMYDVCGKREDGKVLNCPYSLPAVTPSAFLSSKIQSLCPTITGDICCTEEQFNILRSQVQQVVPFLTGCPACLRNFLNMFCELSCSPNQSQFINVTSISEENRASSTVEGIDFFVTQKFKEELFDSCKDVKFGALNTRAMEFVGGGAKTYQEFYAFVGKLAELGEPGSPYAINFRTSNPEYSGMIPLDTKITPCWDSSLSCSCGDCPAANHCSDSFPSSTNHTTDVCSFHIGKVQMRCVDFGVGIVYIILLVAIFTWWWGCDQVIGSIPPEAAEPLLENGEAEPSEISTVELTEKEQLKTPETDGPYIEKLLSKWFRSLGTGVARRPGFVLVVALLVTIVLCSGLFFLQVETRPEKLWVSPGSTAASEKNFFDTHLAPFYRIEQIILATKASDGKAAPSILNDENLLLMFDMQEKVDSIRANFSGNLVSLQDICMKPFGTFCATQSVLQYFKMDRDLFDEYEGSTHAAFCFDHYSSSEPCLSLYQSPLDPDTVVGGYEGSNYTQATAFTVTYPVTNAVEGSDNSNDAAVAWEKEFIRLAKEELQAMAASRNLTLSYSSESSIESELKRESYTDIGTIVISYFVMFIYIAITLGDSAPEYAPFYVTSKVLLGAGGVLIVGLSVLGSVGFFSLIEVKSTLIIAEVIPFLVLAVGVDNMCILVHALKRQDAQLPLDARVGNALAEVGPSITLASLSEFLAFAIGTFTPMPACRVFSMFAAFAVLLDYILQVTAFVALMTYDMKRTESNRIDCLPCITIHQEDEFDPAFQRQDRQPGLLTLYMERVHAPVLLTTTAKAIVLAFFSALLLVSIALSTRLGVGLDQKVALPRDSYLQDYFNDLTTYLRVGPPLYFVVQDFNYSSASNQTNKLCSISKCFPDSLLNEISKSSTTPETSFIARPAASWLDDFLVWTSPDAFGCCRKFPNGDYCPPDDQPPCCPEGDDYCGESETCKDCTTCFLRSNLTHGRPSTVQFKEKLPWFLDALPSADCSKGGRGAYSTSLDLTGLDNGTIKAFEFRTYHTPLNKQTDFVDALRAVKEFSNRISKSLNISVFPYSVFYIFFEQYLDIWYTTLMGLVLAIGAVFLVCFIVTNSLHTAAIILAVLVMIVVDLLGVMAVWDIQLNAVSLVNLIMSVGIAVEFCVHITHAFSVSSGDRNMRATKALATMGASVFSGITLTKLVGVLVLFFAKSEIFEVYYFRMYLGLVALGFLHGLIFLPVLLSICGPSSKEERSAYVIHDVLD